MSDLVSPPPDALGASPAAEFASARVALRALDKASRAVRTYGFVSAVTERFFQQLYAALDAHLSSWAVLGVIVEAGEFRMGQEVVWRSEDSVGEGLSFRLYGDGIRELRFHDGLSEQDLHHFLEALWANDASNDDDVVTRLWAKDLVAVSFVTAEDILKAPWTTGPLALQDAVYFSLPPASFRGVIEREQGKLAAGSAISAPPGSLQGGGSNLNLKTGGPSAQGVVGFEVTAEDRARIAAELAAEDACDSAAYVLQALRAIIASERVPDLLTRVLALVPALFDDLLAAGRWASVQEVLAMVDQGRGNLAFDPTHHALSDRAVESLSAPARVELIATGLNLDPARAPDGLAEVLARLQPSAVGPLCGVLANVQALEHRWVVREALSELGRKNQEPVLRGLAGPRAETVRDLIEVILSWDQEPAVDVLAMLADHADRDVRRDAVAAIASLRPRGDGALLIGFASDADRAVRLQVLRLLMAGQYKAPWEAWVPHSAPGAVAELPGGDRRALFLAMRATSGDALVPFLASLLREKEWPHRQKGEQAALAAVDSLLLSGTAEARAALEAGQTSGNSAVQKACVAALQALVRRAQKES